MDRGTYNHPPAFRACPLSPSATKRLLFHTAIVPANHNIDNTVTKIPKCFTRATSFLAHYGLYPSQ